MPDMQTIQEQVQERLGELEQQIEALSAEFEQLKSISAMLESTKAPSNGVAPRPRRRPAAKAAPPTPSRSRPQRGGNRAHQALELIAAQPGLTAAELAQTMGMKRNYLYRVLPALEKEGKVTKQGKGYHPAGGAQTAA